MGQLRKEVTRRTTVTFFFGNDAATKQLPVYPTRNPFHTTVTASKPSNLNETWHFGVNSNAELVILLQMVFIRLRLAESYPVITWPVEDSDGPEKGKISQSVYSESAETIQQCQTALERRQTERSVADALKKSTPILLPFSELKIS